MKSLPAGLLAHYQTSDHTVAACVRIERRDGLVFNFTALDRDLVVNGETYRAILGVDTSDATTASTLDADNVDVRGATDPAGIAAAEIAAGRWDGATFLLFLVNWADPAGGIEIIKKGEVGDLRFGRVGYEATMVGLPARMQNNVGRVILPTCDAAFGDARCGVNKATHTLSSVAVTAVASRASLTFGSIGAAAGTYNDGEIVGVTGANAGVLREIRAQTSGGVVELHEALPYAVTVGDTFSVARGCSKVKADATNGCTFYSNVLNFRGFAEVPGLDTLVRRAS